MEKIYKKTTPTPMSPSSQPSSALQELLQQTVKSTPSSILQGILTDHVSIPKRMREMVSTSQQNMRTFLDEKYNEDPTFPRILDSKDTHFMGGSFDRHTKPRPLDDIDLYFPLDGQGYYYLSNGLRLPYTVLSDNKFESNPLANHRWSHGALSGTTISSTKLIRGFSEVLKKRFPRTEIKSNGQAVSVYMTHGESDSSDGLTYDIVPCFSLKPDNTIEPHVYLIPDGKDDWIRTNPRLDKAIADRLHATNNKTFWGAVRLIKYWNAQYINKALVSYYIELAVARGFEERNSYGTVIPSLSMATAIGFLHLQQALNLGAQPSRLPQAPAIAPGTLSDTQANKLREAVGRAVEAGINEEKGNINAATDNWRAVFPNETQ
jgi:hypothetical protein